MGAETRFARPLGRLRLDWLLLAVGLVAGVFLVGLLVRADRPDGFGPAIGGMRLLSGNETLLAFEDYTHGPGAWEGQPVDRSQIGLGGVIGPLPLQTALSRDFPLPDDTARAVLQFDLIGLDDWAAEVLTVSIGDRLVLQQGLSTDPDAVSADVEGAMPGGGISVAADMLTPVRDRGFGGGDPTLRDAVLRVRIAVDTPDRPLTLSITGSGAQGDGDAPQWALDNLSLVAQRLP